MINEQMKCAVCGNTPIVQITITKPQRIPGYNKFEQHKSGRCQKHIILNIEDALKNERAIFETIEPC